MHLASTPEVLPNVAVSIVIHHTDIPPHSGIRAVYGSISIAQIPKSILIGVSFDSRPYIMQSATSWKNSAKSFCIKSPKSALASNRLEIPHNKVKFSDVDKSFRRTWCPDKTTGWMDTRSLLMVGCGRLAACSGPGLLLGNSVTLMGTSRRFMKVRSALMNVFTPCSSISSDQTSSWVSHTRFCSGMRFAKAWLVFWWYLQIT